MLPLTRDEVIESLNEIIVAPAIRTIRGLATEVVLTRDDGMPVARALNFDHTQRARLGRMIARLPAERWHEVENALPIACGFATTEAG